MRKKGGKVLLCVTGSIAAFKTPELVRQLVRTGCEVEIIMTGGAERFVTPMTLSTLSGHRVWRQEDFLSEAHGFEIPHIRLGEWGEVFVVAPCSAEAAAALAQGRADSLMGAAFLASRAPILIFPAMNERMLDHPATQTNLKSLTERGARVIEPALGPLACGGTGRGRMPEPEEIVEEILRALPSRDMEGLHVLVTAGPTHEYLDPVRYLSNPSSGRMGLAMARAAWRRGAEVRLVLGPVTPPGTLYGLKTTPVASALEMYDAVMENLPWADFIIKAAAVGDYRAKAPAGHKVKREGHEEIALEPIQNPDIAAEVGRRKRPDQILVGFAAETDNVAANARAKLERKGLDFVLANDVLEPGSGFRTETNTLRLISRDAEESVSGLKEEAAAAAWDFLMRRSLVRPH